MSAVSWIRTSLMLAIGTALATALLDAQEIGMAADSTHEARSPEAMYFFARLEGTRPGWPENMTPEEERIMGEHFAYLQKLVAKKKVIAAGPVFEPVFGLVILRVASEQEAREIMDHEPSIVQGVMTYKLAPMRLPLLADHVPADRYVTAPTDRVLTAEAVVPAGSRAVWEAFTTSSGIESFLGTKANIELRQGGPYEIYFSGAAPYGERGSEDCRVLSFLPERMLSFEWNAPPSFGDLRDKRTLVVMQFEPVDSAATRVRLTQLGWGAGAEWNAVYAYFARAWPSVLENCRAHFARTEER
jgi:uncharacterized protein YndB with AHSA1/START domain/uncharacterized protein YciI